MIDAMQALRKNDSVNAIQLFTDLPQRLKALRRQSEGNACDEEDLQEPRRENGRHEYFLFQRHLQLPETRHRKYQNYKVRNDVENPSGLKDGINAKAMAPLQERIPDLLAWSTQGDSETDRDDIKYQVTPDTKIASDIDKYVAFFSRYEDVKVLK